jgi:hypothetical protein
MGSAGGSLDGGGGDLLNAKCHVLESQKELCSGKCWQLKMIHVRFCEAAVHQGSYEDLLIVAATVSPWVLLASPPAQNPPA